MEAGAFLPNAIALRSGCAQRTPRERRSAAGSGFSNSLGKCGTAGSGCSDGRALRGRPHVGVARSGEARFGASGAASRPLLRLALRYSTPAT